MSKPPQPSNQDEEDSVCDPTSKGTAKDSESGCENSSTAGRGLKPRLYKTRMCSFFQRQMCDRGDQCKFAHYQSELKPKPNFHCTKLCPNLPNCTKEGCTYAHDESQLRPVSVTRSEGGKTIIRLTAGVNTEPTGTTGGGGSTGGDDNLRRVRAEFSDTSSLNGCSSRDNDGVSCNVVRSVIDSHRSCDSVVSDATTVDGWCYESRRGCSNPVYSSEGFTDSLLKPSAVDNRHLLESYQERVPDMTGFEIITPTIQPVGHLSMPIFNSRGCHDQFKGCRRREDLSTTVAMRSFHSTDGRGYDSNRPAFGMCTVAPEGPPIASGTSSSSSSPIPSGSYSQVPIAEAYIGSNSTNYPLNVYRMYDHAYWTSLSCAMFVLNDETE
ncbi:hypothetical protein FOL47_008180 [Perkinsus chesapeaki]|uniref:C3H1-type domain-containing protein n=1 Tax=Perkinsus chesapeaki TaxID=330153 RepID=A0A7J6MUD3_PERCH|nr:hypothetical protein FOL47_008180 [Perkinsus chesapeaki]